MMQPGSKKLKDSIRNTCYVIFALTGIAAAAGTRWLLDKPNPLTLFLVVLMLVALFVFSASVLSNIVLNQVSLLEYRVQQRMGRTDQKINPTTKGTFSIDRGIVDFVMDEEFEAAWRKYVPPLLRRITDYSREPRRYLLAQEFHGLEATLSKSRVADLALQSIKQELFQHFSHQLKTPMTVILSHVEGAREAIRKDEPNSLLRSMAGVESACRSASTLVDQLLSMAFVQGLERRGLTHAVVNAAIPVREAVESRMYLAQKRGLTITTDIGHGTLVAGEAALIQEMVACLLDNCICYVDERGHIDISCHIVQGSLEITVLDDGPGIPSSERGRVLQAFYGQVGVDDTGRTMYGTRRRHSNTVNDKASHGLGLSLVASIMALHKGQVILDDRADGRRGLKVTCRFPMVRPGST